MNLSAYQKYCNWEQQTAKNKKFPCTLEIHTYPTDGCGDPINEEQDFLNGNFYRTVYQLENERELFKLYEELNPHTWKRYFFK
jgi:hypothetical protein